MCLIWDQLSNYGTWQIHLLTDKNSYKYQGERDSFQDGHLWNCWQAVLLYFAGQEVPKTVLGTYYMIFSMSVYILGININSYWDSFRLVILYDYLARCLLFLGMFIYFVMHESNKTFLAWCKQMLENTTMPFYLSVFPQWSSYTDSPTLTVGNIALMLLWNWLNVMTKIKWLCYKSKTVSHNNVYKHHKENCL